MRGSRLKAAQDVAALTDMPLGALREEWRRRYGEAPRHRSADLLRRVLAWRIQADVRGGLDAPTRRMLEKGQGRGKTVPATGMRLAREWEGRRYEVTITEGGVVLEGRRFGSLSEAARHITGQRWNGPRFFGLRQANVR